MKFILPRKFVLWNFNLRLFAILTFAVGVSAAWNWQPKSKQTPASFLVHLQSEPETIMQNRNLSDYDLGGQSVDCFNNFDIERKKCEVLRNKARDFILKHWQDKTRAYIIIEFNGVDTFSNYHVFIEPDKNDEWHIIWREEISSFNRGFGGTIVGTDARFVERKRATKNDYPYKLGSSYLVFSDKDGKTVLDF